MLNFSAVDVLICGNWSSVQSIKNVSSIPVQHENSEGIQYVANSRIILDQIIVTAYMKRAGKVLIQILMIYMPGKLELF